MNPPYTYYQPRWLHDPLKARQSEWDEADDLHQEHISEKSAWNAGVEWCILHNRDIGQLVVAEINVVYYWEMKV